MHIDWPLKWFSGWIIWTQAYPSHTPFRAQNEVWGVQVWGGLGLTSTMGLKDKYKKNSFACKPEHRSFIFFTDKYTYNVRQGYLHQTFLFTLTFCKKQTGCFCYCTFKTGSAPKLEKCNFVSQVYSKVKDMHPKYFLDSVQKEILIRLFSNYLAVYFCLWYLAKLHVDLNRILKFTSPLCAVFEDGYLYDMWFGVAACVELSKSLTSKIPFHLLTRLWNRA